MNSDLQKLTAEYSQQEQLNNQINKLQKTEESLKQLLENNKDIDNQRALQQYNRTAAAEISAVLKVLQDNDRNLNDGYRNLKEKEGSLTGISQQIQERQQDFAKLETYNEDHLMIINRKNALEDDLKKYQKYRDFSDEISKEQKKLTTLIEQLSAENSRLRNMEKAYYLGQAYVMSQKLKDNEPCPVCGSLHHPAPARKEPENVSQEQLDSQREITNKFENRKIACESKIDRNNQQRDELDIAFELPGMKLSLEEIGKLVVGQTFTLEYEVKDVPIRICVGGQTYALGRLVDVGGQAGVQITKLSATQEKGGA